MTNATTAPSTRRSHAWSEFPGASRGATLVRRTLQKESAGVPALGQHQRKATRRGQRGGRRARRLHERQISCQATSSCGRKARGCADVRTPEFSKTGRRTTPRAWRCLGGWRRLCPSRSRRPYPLPVRAAMANELTRQWYMLMAVALPLGLKKYLRPIIPQNGSDRGKEGCIGQLEFDRVSARKMPPDKDRGLGRQCAPGLRTATMDEAAMATPDKWYRGRDTNCGLSV